jgi:serine/threonine-protein kinase
MELLEGEDIASLAARVGGRLAPGDVLFIAERALDVLAAAHALNVIHRDFKPENVFCTTGGGVKVLDFGIARLRELGRTSLTQPGSLMGTPAFMPPEQARGRVAEVDARLLSGRHVFEGRTASELLLAAMCETAPPVRQILPSIPSDVAEIVDRALLPERDARWPDARTMQAAVRDALLDHPPEALASDFDRRDVPAHHPPGRERSRRVPSPRRLEASERRYRRRDRRLLEGARDRPWLRRGLPESRSPAPRPR